MWCKRESHAVRVGMTGSWSAATGCLRGRLPDSFSPALWPAWSGLQRLHKHLVSGVRAGFLRWGIPGAQPCRLTLGDPTACEPVPRSLAW